MMRISSLKLRFSESGELDVPLEGAVIFVGPNNSGKSLVLRELEQAVSAGSPPHAMKIVVDFSIDPPSPTEIDAIEERTSVKFPETSPGHMLIYRVGPHGGHEHQSLSRAWIEQQTAALLANEAMAKYQLAQHMVRYGLLRLDGRSRFGLSDDRSGGDLLSHPNNILASLFTDDITRAKVREIIKDAFNLYFVVDPTSLGQLRIRLSSTEPLNDEQSLNASARDFYGKALHIKDASDGVQAFTGIIVAVCAGDYHTLLIDEPEAFLHPPLARKLGRHLSDVARQQEGALIASTHSADFLLGCFENATALRVIRLEHRDGKSKARMIDPNTLRNFLRKPLMRSANVVSGLFHDGVVVTESDNDRSFYSQIYARMTDGRAGAPSLLFVNAQNKQTIRDIIGPLRGFGVPAVAVPDMDLVNDGGQTWTNWMKAARVPEALHGAWGQQRSAVRKAFGSAGVDVHSGISSLSGSDLEAAEVFLDSLQDYGIFTVRSGELESWLPHLKVAGKKTDWTIAMLERLGDDSTHADYVTPGEGDVWAFMEGIIAWISDPSRRGVN